MEQDRLRRTGSSHTFPPNNSAHLASTVNVCVTWVGTQGACRRSGLWESAVSSGPGSDWVCIQGPHTTENPSH